MSEYATGGTVYCPRDPSDDSIPFEPSRDYIVNRAAAEAIGEGLLKLINDEEP